MYKKAKYKIVNSNMVPEVVHYETSGEQVKFFDENNIEVGTLRDLVSGKELKGADILSIKHSGTYIVSDMKNPPVPIVGDKTVILQATAVGAVGSPSFVHFTFINSTGEVYHNTVVGSKSSGWSSGGKTLKEEISNINKSISDSKSKIENTQKNLLDLTTSFSKLETDYKIHNHDEKYLKLSGGTITGDVGLRYGGNLKFVSAQGESRNFASYSVNSGAILGDSNVVLDIKSKDHLKHNGKKVWSEVNDGKGSGLDADKLQGISGDQFARLNSVNTFTQETWIEKGKSITFKDNSASPGVFWYASDNTHRASIRSDQNGSIVFYQKGGISYNKFDPDGHITSYKGINFNAERNESHAVFKLNNSDAGIGFYRNNGSKYLGIYDWTNKKRLGYFHQTQGHLYLDEAPSIKGRRLYLQSSTPTGARTVGDIWIS